jgi:aspartyl-tRNA synthetase
MALVFRTMTCGEARPLHVGQQVILSGWVHKSRNLGSMVFVDLRDRFGITQILFDPRYSPKEVYEAAKGLGHEFVICVEGEVVLRESPNPKIPTGLVEVRPQKLTVLSEAAVPPFPIADETIEPHEDVRLQYRYLDMRRGHILPSLLVRHSAMQATRAALCEEGFTEVTTPMLSKATPEGSRDYLVPSRMHQGQFYALPQSPQMYKQLLMIGGLDRYFQIATCCRDEDLRSDRQPEFHQIDVEMSFATREQLFPIAERVIQRIFRECKGIELKAPFPRLTYRECMERYGSDKPDVRFGMELVDLTDLGQRTSFSPFVEAIAAKGSVRGVPVPGGATLSRKAIDEYQQLVSQFGFKGIGWIRRAPEGLQGSILKHIDQQDHALWCERFGLREGDLGFILAGPTKRLLQALDQLRRRLGKDLNLIDHSRYEPLWVIDFPLFSWNEEENKLEAENHPFTSPNFDDIGRLEEDPLSVRSLGYDLVLNGYEISSGSQRIHDSRLQERIFRLLGYTDEERALRFGFFVEALTYGTPPHLGMALGLDRIVMILTGTENIRDVVAFPKNQRAMDLMTTAPSGVPLQQLQELGISIRTP